MTFFDPTPKKKHSCPLPEHYGALKGWRCKCGKSYVVEHLSARDVAPGELHWQWKRSPEHDETT